MFIELRSDVVECLNKGTVITDGDRRTYVTLQGSFESTSNPGIFIYKKSKINSLIFWQSQNK